jgi:hypothetical protein
MCSKHILTIGFLAPHCPMAFQHHNNKPVTSTTMNEPTPDVPSALTTMTLEQIDALARQLIPVPTATLVITVTFQTMACWRAPMLRWNIGHFTPDISYQCTMGEGSTPNEAISNLIQKLAPTTPQ